MHAADARAHYSAGTTKGTGGDVIILEEAAYVSQDFFYETVAPLLLVGVTTLICISTLTSELSFYTRLFKIKDPVTGLPVFAQFQVSLACDACKDAGMAASCRHMLHLVPTWQSSVRHERLKAVMADRPDLIQSELSGLAFDSLQQCFRGHDITTMLSAPVPTPLTWSQVLLFSSYYDWDRTRRSRRHHHPAGPHYGHRPRRGRAAERLCAHHLLPPPRATRGASRAYVFDLELALELVGAHGLVDQEAADEVPAQHL